MSRSNQGNAPSDVSKAWRTALHALTLSQENASAIKGLDAEILLILSVLANRVQGGTTTGLGTGTAFVTLPAITTTPSATGRFEVSAFGEVKTTTPGDSVTATILRDTVPLLLTAVTFLTDATDSYALSIGPFVDTAGALTPHTYAIQLVNNTAGQAILSAPLIVLAQEVF